MEPAHGQTPLLSVVVPTYNGEDFLAECLDSILGQTFADFELICVDDGSTDGAPALLDEYASKDGRMRVLRQENQGVSAARNTGMSAARGTYLLFFDDDDWLEPTAFEKTVGQLEQDGADVCVCGGRHYDMRFGEKRAVPTYLNMSCLPPELPVAASQIQPYLFNFTNFSVFNKVYRVDALREAGVRFRPSNISEDAVFVAETLVAIRSITVVDEPLVVHRVNTGTSLVDTASDDILAAHRALLFIKHVLVENGLYSDALQQSFANKALNNLLYFRWLASTPESLSQWYCALKNGGLEQLDILGHDESYFYKESDYEQLCEVVDSTDLYEYLFVRYRKTIHARDEAQAAHRRKNAQCAGLKRKNSSLESEQRQLKDRVSSLKGKNEALREKRDALKQRNESLKRKNEALREKRSALKQRNESLRRKNAKLEDELARIKASRSYRFALKLRAVAKKLGIPRR